MTQEYTHCPKCGGRLRTRRLEDRDRLVCASCGFVFYRNPVPAAGVIVIDDGKLLWVQRKFEPRKGMWNLPAGFVEYGEHVESCAVREAKEETGLDVEIDGLFNAYMAMDDPRGQVVLLLYSARVRGGQLRPGDDAADARWVPLEETPGEIAFRAHVLALEDVRERRPRDRDE
jgi:ADP-ribose pyrophosphatase YjhB (NUDIX family)